FVLTLLLFFLITTAPTATSTLSLHDALPILRTAADAGAMERRARAFGTTWIASVADAGPALAVSVARPGASAWSRPSGVTETTFWLLDQKDTRSARRSPCFEYAVPTSVSRVSTTSFAGVGATSTCAGDSGRTCTRANSIFCPGWPGIVATAATRATPA